ncbi:MAG TPA: hypothetical protein VII39_01360 [Bradyrhizobium sp.]
MTQHMKSMTMAAGLLAGCLVVVVPAAQAQPAPSTTQQMDTLGSIHASIVKAIGADAKTVHITSNGSVLVVARINSNMNGTTHEGRNNEAKVIAALAAKEIAGEPKFAKVSTIRVEYSAHAAPAKSKLVDSVEFRKGPDGVFDFHET